MILAFVDNLMLAVRLETIAVRLCSLCCREVNAKC